MAYLSVDIDIRKEHNGIKIEDFKKYFQSLSDNKISVGVHKDKGRLAVLKAQHTEFGTMPPNDTKVGKDIPTGFKHPFGHSGVLVPPRPVIRMYLYQDIKEQISNEYQLALNSAKRTKLKNPSNNAIDTQKRLGQECVYMQRDKLNNGGYDTSTNMTGLDPEHNGLKTIKYKGFDNPWVQTGATNAAIDYKVEKRST